MKLNPKQKRFCDEYLVDLNATQAYIRAGYSKKGAEVSAHKLLRNTNIEKYIQLKQNKYQEALDLTIEEVVTMIIETAKNGEQENNRLKATDMLMKHLGGYIEKLEIRGEIEHTQYYAPKKDKSL